MLRPVSLVGRELVRWLRARSSEGEAGVQSREHASKSLWMSADAIAAPKGVSASSHCVLQWSVLTQCLVRFASQFSSVAGGSTASPCLASGAQRRAVAATGATGSVPAITCPSRRSTAGPVTMRMRCRSCDLQRARTWCRRPCRMHCLLEQHRRIVTLIQRLCP
jgi:hypothetical protein